MFHHTNLHFNEKLKQRKVTNCIVVHHSEVNTPHNVNDIHQWHQKKGWAGIGYHYFISKGGEIYEGRPYDTIGAHAYGYNKESIGVCFEGNFNKEKMNDKQLDASIMLLSVISLAFDAPLVPHSGISKKNCPGKNFPMEEIQQKVGNCKESLISLFGTPHTTGFAYASLLRLLTQVEY